MRANKKNKQIGLVAIVGRANVGKSTLFNRIIGRRKSIVTDVAGTTRDVVLATAEWLGSTFWLADTAGIYGEKESDEIIRSVEKQISESIEEADVILWVVDGSAGVMNEDEKIVRNLRKKFEKVILVVNKSDKKEAKENVGLYEKFGFKDIFALSAIDGIGVGDLLDYVVKRLPKKVMSDDGDDSKIKVCLMGRPNVGKSSLVNQIFGEEKRVVSSVAGTTRDVGEIDLIYKQREIVLFDTAGVCRNSKQYVEKMAKYSIMRSVTALRESEVAVMMIDGIEGLTKRDLMIIDMILQVRKGIVLFVNKWDLAEESGISQDKFVEGMLHKLQYIYWLPVVFGSAKTGKNINHLLDQIVLVADNGRKVIDQSQWDEFARDLQLTNEVAKKIGLVRIQQVGMKPVTIRIKYKGKRSLLPHEEKSLVNTIRDYLRLNGVQIVVEKKK